MNWEASDTIKFTLRDLGIPWSEEAKGRRGYGCKQPHELSLHQALSGLKPLGFVNTETLAERFVMSRSK